MAEVLLVDDDRELLDSTVRALSGLIRPLTMCAAGSVEGALRIAREEKPHVAVIDLCLDPHVGVESGFSLLASLQTIDSALRTIVLTGHGALEHGVKAISCGAAHFVAKPVEPAHLAVLITDAARQCELRREHQRLLRQSCRESLLAGLSGSSAAMEKLRDHIAFLASTTQPVLICGETGVGKGVCARVIHQRSARATRKFVHFHPNFGGGDLVQSQLFGHVRGAFTGATEARRGLVCEADGGTLFIDELDEVPHQTQVSLLDVVQEQRVRPIGSDNFTAVDCRFIAATNRALDEALRSGKIRRDLHHRLAHAVVTIPPLRERREDIPELVDTLLRRCREQKNVNVFEISDDALAALQAREWPGNVRELQGAIELAAYHAQFKGRTVIVSGDLPHALQAVGGDGVGEGTFHEQVERFKVRIVRESLALCSGNKVKASRQLGLDRGTMRRILSRGAAC